MPQTYEEALASGKPIWETEYGQQVEGSAGLANWVFYTAGQYGVKTDPKTGYTSPEFGYNDPLFGQGTDTGYDPVTGIPYSGATNSPTATATDINPSIPITEPVTTTTTRPRSGWTLPGGAFIASPMELINRSPALTEAFNALPTTPYTPMTGESPNISGIMPEQTGPTPATITTGGSVSGTGASTIGDPSTIDRLIDLIAAQYASVGSPGKPTGGIVAIPAGTDSGGGEAGAVEQPKSKKGLMILLIIAVAIGGYVWYRKHKAKRAA